MKNEHIIQVNDLKFKYDSNSELVLNGINLTINKGEIIAIVGLSGCGKSTLLNCLNGIIPNVIKGEYQGEVLLKGQNIIDMNTPEIATILGTVFQDPDNQIIFSTVEDEMAFGPENLCVKPDDIRNRINEVTELLNITNLLKRNPNTLSGGEKQLVVLASILTLGVDILILDESMSQVDTKGRELIKDRILKMKAQGKTIIMVEHDFENLDIADKVYLLKDSKLIDFEGKIL